MALVTGAAGGGIGRSIALTLAREGASVVVNYRTSQAAADQVVAEIQKAGGSAAAVQGDVFTRAGCQKLVEAAVENFGRVDICIIGPGGGWNPEPPDQLAADGALEDLCHEAAPVLFLLPLLLPGMYARGWGRVIGIGMNMEKPSPAYAYNLGKAARRDSLLLAAGQAWKHGVTINVIAPGPVAAIQTLEEAVEQAQHGQRWLARANVSPQDMAEGAAFLCSDTGRFINGCVLQYEFLMS